MAGHSKWANIKHRKARVDAKRGKLWSKCSRASIAAARAGGADPATNLALRYAIDEARYANMPKDTIERAIARGAGGAGGESFEQVRYEGYGPGGAAVLVDTLTDNRTRTVGELRVLFNRAGGNMGTTGCVSYLFDARGQILVDAGSVEEDRIMDAAVEAGAEDVQAPEQEGEGFWTVLTEPTRFEAVRNALEEAGIPIADAQLAMIPRTTVELRGSEARGLVGLVEGLEDNDDVQKVYTNAQIPDEELADVET
jgi:YebC/PmpR family DNA-binding regulatory protein